jgi:hypothetical protein
MKEWPKRARVDLYMSTWILVWWGLYIGHVTSLSPKFLLIIGLIGNIIGVAIAGAMHASIQNVIIMCLITAIIKCIPLYIIWNSPITKQSVMVSIVLYIFYFVWLEINHTNMWEVYSEVLEYFT